jgi:hypothetical protein
MENGIKTLNELFKVSSFTIPQYQRAYSWEEVQLEQFVEDLRQQVIVIQKSPEKSYFLGSLLLHKKDEGVVHIVDGQQRLTTSVIFIAAALSKCSDDVFEAKELKRALLRRSFVHDDDAETQKFKTIAEDNPFFRTQILGLNEAFGSTQDSPSARKIKKAFDFFLSDIGDSEWASLLKILINAKVMVYSVSSSADATQIFEFQNDRGKKLTDLESLKSYLMHLIYLHAKNPNDGLEIVQEYFAKIYRNIEKQSKISWMPREDAILSYHAVASLQWSVDEWRHPKGLVRKLIKRMSDSSDIQKWILKFVGDLNETYQLLSTISEKVDQYRAFTELLIIDRMATFWPLIIKGYRLDDSSDKRNFNKLLRLMEVYAFRGYGLSKLRSDSGMSALYLKTRDFCGDFSSVFDSLHAMSSWNDVDTRYLDGLNRAGFYRSNRKEAQYILWRYENHLRSQVGQKHELISWRHYLKPENNASKLSVEHIAAQDNPIGKTEVKWDEKDEASKKFMDIAMHRIGNLVIDSCSSNSSKGKKDFSDKLKSLSSDSPYLSQGELINYSVTDATQWDVKAIIKRQKRLVDFVIDTWSPSKYHRPSKTNDSEAEFYDSNELGSSDMCELNEL